MKRIISIIVLCLMCLGLFACDKEPKKVEQDLKISGETTVKVGEQLTLTPEVSGIDNPDYEWVVNDDSIASIKDGVLTALAEGTVLVVLLENTSGLQDTISIVVTKGDTLTTKLAISGADKCSTGEGITLIAIYDNGSNVDLEWSSSDENIATVENGVVRGIAKGSVVITLKDKKSNLSAQKNINIVKDVITIDDMLDWAFAESGTESLDDLNLPTSNPDTGATFAWTTNRPDLLLIDDGYVEFVEVDEVCELTCTATYNGETKSRTIEFKVLGYAAYDVYNLFMKQFKGNQIFNDMTDMETSFDLYGGSTVKLESHNRDVFADNGKLTKSFYDETVNVTLHITLKDPAFKKDIDVTLTAKAMDVDERKALISSWIDKNMSPDGYVYKTTTFPSHIDDYDVDLEWLNVNGGKLNVEFSIDNPILGDSLGVVINIVCGDGSKYNMEKTFRVAVSKITDPWEKIDLLVNTISQTDVKAFSYHLISWMGYSNGYVPFVTDEELPIIQDILGYTDGKNRTGITKTSTEYIVVHDTGSPSKGADATMHNNYIKNLNYSTDENKRVVSWHFTIDDKLCYQHLPLNEVAWHAGDGSHRYGDIYYNDTYKKSDCIGGGNYNGIGIESCVNEGTDYTYTMRRLAKLVASLLVKYNLGLDRVKQHWHFSGKNCPQVMRENNRWNEFLYLVKLEYYLMTELKGAKLEWTSLTPEIMDNEGRIIGKQANGTTVSYKVKVTYNGTSKEYTFSSRLSVN